MSSNFKGKVIAVMAIEKGVGKATGKEWTKQDFVVEEQEGQYPKKACFSMLEKNASFGGLAVGMDVDVSYNLESREYNGKWYTNNPTAWKINLLASGSGPVPPPLAQPQRQEIDPYDPNAKDDLPF